MWAEGFIPVFDSGAMLEKQFRKGEKKRQLWRENQAAGKRSGYDLLYWIC